MGDRQGGVTPCAPNLLFSQARVTTLAWRLRVILQERLHESAETAWRRVRCGPKRVLEGRHEEGWVAGLGAVIGISRWKYGRRSR